MKGLMSYSGIVTKIKAMQAKLLTENDFDTIAEKIIATGIKAEFAKEIENHIYQWRSMHPEEIEKVEMKKIEIYIKNSQNR